MIRNVRRLMMRLKSDLVEAMLATVEQRLDQITLEWDERIAVCVVVACEGYGWKPDDQVKKGAESTGLEEAAKVPETQVFQAGTAMKDGKLVTAGGRGAGGDEFGWDAGGARGSGANAAFGKIHFEGRQWRRHIGGQAGR